MALKIFLSRFHRRVKPEEFEVLMARLQREGFKLLIRSANAAYFGALGLDESSALRSTGTLLGERQLYMSGDLIPAQDWSEVVHVALRQEFSRGRRGRPRQKHYLEVGSITKVGGTPLLDRIKGVVATILGVPSSILKPWMPLRWGNPTFDELSGQGVFERGSFALDEKSAAEQLRGRNTWKLAVAVKAAGGMLIRDFSQVGGNTEEGSKLENAGLLKKELVVICKATSRLLNRLASADGLKQLDEHGVVCASCGKRLSDERLDELLVPTELAKKLLDHNRWMAAILLDRVQKLGISFDRVLLEFREGSEEVDAFVDLDGFLAMVELKDKEFSMGHAYPLSGRIAMYHPQYVVIVTSERVAPEVRDYFQRIKPEARLTYVEGLDSLEDQLEDVVNTVRGERATTLLERFNPLTIGVDIPALIGTKLNISLPKRETPSMRTLGRTFRL